MENDRGKFSRSPCQNMIPDMGCRPSDKQMDILSVKQHTLRCHALCSTWGSVFPFWTDHLTTYISNISSRFKSSPSSSSVSGTDEYRFVGTTIVVVAPVDLATNAVGTEAAGEKAETLTSIAEKTANITANIILTVVVVVETAVLLRCGLLSLWSIVLLSSSGGCQIVT